MLTLFIFTLTFIINEGTIGYSLLTTFNVMQYWLIFCILFDAVISVFIIYFALSTNATIKIASSIVLGYTLFADIILYLIASTLSEEIHNTAVSLSQFKDNHIILMFLFFIILVFNSIIALSIGRKKP